VRWERKRRYRTEYDFIVGKDAHEGEEESLHVLDITRVEITKDPRYFNFVTAKRTYFLKSQYKDVCQVWQDNIVRLKEELLLQQKIADFDEGANKDERDFANQDIDNDGAISKQEWEARFGNLDDFAKYDLDNNGKVDADEYRMGKISTTMFVDGDKPVLSSPAVASAAQMLREFGQELAKHKENFSRKHVELNELHQGKPVVDSKMKTNKEICDQNYSELSDMNNFVDQLVERRLHSIILQHITDRDSRTDLTKQRARYQSEADKLRQGIYREMFKLINLDQETQGEEEDDELPEPPKEGCIWTCEVKWPMDGWQPAEALRDPIVPDGSPDKSSGRGVRAGASHWVDGNGQGLGIEAARLEKMQR